MIRSFTIRHMHIELGERASSENCPLSLCLSELFPLCKARVEAIEEGTFIVLTRKDSGRQLRRQVPRETAEWVAHYDYHGWGGEHTCRMEFTAGEWDLISPALSPLDSAYPTSYNGLHRK